MKNINKNSVAEEALFWLHFALIIVFIFSGLFIPFRLLVLIVVIWNIHIVILGRCVLTIMKEKIDPLPEDEEFERPAFLQEMAKRFFNKDMSWDDVHRCLKLIYSLALLIGLIADFYNINFLRL